MSEPVFISYGVLRTFVCDTRGKTFCAHPHTLYPTREEANEAMALAIAAEGLYFQCAYDVVEVRLS